MNNKHLLVNGITLLYRESQVPSITERSSDLVRNIITNIKLPDIQLSLDPETKIITNLRNTALALCNDPDDHIYEPVEILQRLKLDTEDDVELYEAFEAALTSEMSETSLKRTVTNMRRSIQNHFREDEVRKVLNEATSKLKFKPEDIKDFKSFVGGLISSLEPFQTDALTKDPAIISHVSFDNDESMETVFRDIKKEQDGTSILKTGWQGINRMLRGGFRRGENVLIGALQHKYKTGFTLSLFKHFALYNVPEMIDKTKKPLLLRISFEDEMKNNLQFLYTSLKENETRKAVSETELMDLDEATLRGYVQERMKINGYHIEMLRVDPSRWTYLHICNKILELESEGYEIHVCMLDYLGLVPTTGCVIGPAGTDMRDLFRRIRNFTSTRKITTISPHQLSTDAKQLIRDGKEDFVKQIAGKGYYAGCKQLDQEVDLELYIHIEIVNGKSWLTVQRGKHRIVGQTPLVDQFCVLPFEPIGGILDDINGADTTRLKVGGGPIGSGEETPHWGFLDS
jgi:hypothetical protein